MLEGLREQGLSAAGGSPDCDDLFKKRSGNCSENSWKKNTHLLTGNATSNNLPKKSLKTGDVRQHVSAPSPRPKCSPVRHRALWHCTEPRREMQGAQRECQLREATTNKQVPNSAPEMLCGTHKPRKTCPLFTRSQNWTGCPAFLFTKWGYLTRMSP